MILLLLARALRTRRGHSAWATCRTLRRMIGVRGSRVKMVERHQ
jgi:hypothetical protein